MPSVEKDGLGFNPILQDIGLAIHPPILYFGYLGFSVPFSLSIAGLIANTEGNILAKIDLFILNPYHHTLGPYILGFYL